MYVIWQRKEDFKLSRKYEDLESDYNDKLHEDAGKKTK